MTTPVSATWRPITAIAAVLIALTVIAWASLLVGGHLSIETIPGLIADDHHGGSHHPAGHHLPLGSPTIDLWDGLTGWALMTVAMMAPGLLPMAQSWRGRTLRRRWWAVPTIVLAYYFPWIAAGTILIAAVGTYRPTTPMVAVLLLGGSMAAHPNEAVGIAHWPPYEHAADARMAGLGVGSVVWHAARRSLFRLLLGDDGTHGRRRPTDGCTDVDRQHRSHRRATVL